tara:strand:- start:1239 stop:1637 length:399 start_codon:yes stop_codon:yes gene_type:complete
MDKSKKLKYMADDLIKKQDQADALRDLGRRNPEAARRIDNLLAAFGQSNIGSDEVQDILIKFESVISLIKENIKNSRGYENFPESEYREDKNAIFDIKHKMISVQRVTTNDMTYVNKIYKRHLRIQSILSGK